MYPFPGSKVRCFLTKILWAAGSHCQLLQCHAEQEKASRKCKTNVVWCWWFVGFFPLPDLMLRLVLMNSLGFTGAELARLSFLKQDRRAVPVILTRSNVNEADSIHSLELSSLGCFYQSIDYDSCWLPFFFLKVLKTTILSRSISSSEGKKHRHEILLCFLYLVSQPDAVKELKSMSFQSLCFLASAVQTAAKALANI